MKYFNSIQKSFWSLMENIISPALAAIATPLFLKFLGIEIFAQYILVKTFVAMGGIVDPAFVNTMAYVNIQTFGDAVDFGDLTGTARQRGAACSNGHGGL